MPDAIRRVSLSLKARRLLRGQELMPVQDLDRYSAAVSVVGLEDGGHPSDAHEPFEPPLAAEDRSDSRLGVGNTIVRPKHGVRLAFDGNWVRTAEIGRLGPAR